MDIINPFGKDKITVSGEFCGKTITFTVGDKAFQADAGVTVQVDDTVVFSIGQVSSRDIELDYFPLMIDYEEKFYAAGKISGSRFVKREGRPSDHAVQTSRLIDRPIRPLFPKNYRKEVQAIAMVLSYDSGAMPDIIAMNAISAALNLTSAPFEGPIGGVRIGQIDGQLVCNPSTEQLESSTLDLVVAGTKDAIMMVEAGADEIDEATMVTALELAQEQIAVVVALQEELAEKVGVVKAEIEAVQEDEIATAVNAWLDGKMGVALRTANGAERKEKESALKDAMMEALVGDDEEKLAQKRAYGDAFSAAIKQDIRAGILNVGVRPDLRDSTTIRPLSSQIGILPRTHGSSLFTRGATQALNTVTLAPLSYSQMLDSMDKNDYEKRFMHHYNMGGFSVGEVSRPRSAGRREIGHGLLAERALEPMLPNKEDFPYAIRTVSELLSSNGSTSMAATCSSTLSLMDAGVPLKKPVSGIAMGLMIDKEDPSNYVVLSDIQGAEDFAGDMDFKVTGTDTGITALQMDIKVKGLTAKIMGEALAQAKTGRIHILDHMKSVIAEPKAEMSKYAPRIDKIQIDPDMIGAVIGKGGETIQDITKTTGAEIDIQDDGLIMIAAADGEARNKAVEWIKEITAVPEVDKIYTGKVVKILEFGAFVEFMRGHDGMVHISQIKEERVENINDVLKEGQTVTVRLTAIDEKGRKNLTMKGLDQPA